MLQHKLRVQNKINGLYPKMLYTSRAGQAGGGSFKEKNYKSKKVFAYRMCTGWPTTAMPKRSCLSERAFSRSMVVMWWPVLMWLVAGSDEVDVRWGNVVSCEMSCHVMWCNLMCLHFMWCDFLCCVMSRNALRCHVMSCHLLWSDAVQWDEILWVCDALWLVAMSRCVLRNGCVGWIGRWSGDPNYTDLLRTTQYYKVLLRSVLLQYYSVLQSTTPVLVCTARYYSSTTLYYKVLLQYYSVLQKYYSSTSLYYKVLLQYYSVLHRTTPVLLCTTKYYSSMNSVLQSTTPVLLCTTQIYTSTTLYYKVLLQYYSVLQSTTPVLLLVLQSTHLQGAKHQRHQMLRLPRKMTLMIDLRHVWNVIYNAQSNRHHPPTSPNTAPATQNDSHDWSAPHMKRHFQCAEQQASPSNLTKYCACHAKLHSKI